MNSWKGAFIAVLLSGVIFGILNGHLAVWTAVGAALGAVLAGRERNRAIGSSGDGAASSQITRSQNAQSKEMLSN